MAATRPGRPAARRPQRPAEEPPPAPPPPAPPTQGRNLTIPALILGAVVLLAAFLLRGGGDDEGAAVPAAETEEVEAEEGEVVALDPITLNLADGSIVKLAIALQLTAEVVDAEAAIESPAAFGARALDETILVFGSFTRATLLKPGGIAEAKAQLSDRVSDLYGGEVSQVYVTQLVVA